ncbi:MAG: ABC transporter substrate-binding protein, partial [Microthrixaceae bacterium]
MSRTLKLMLALIAATTLVAASCAAQGDDEGASEEPSSNEDGNDGGTGGNSSGADEGSAFGDLDNLCGSGDYTIAEDENAGSPDKLLLGVSNDRTSQIRPGLNKEMWDSSNAFVNWCNEQGGIGGLEIEIVDLDGKLLEVESAMARACNGVFMMVGGGQVQDNLQFTGKPDSDFHQCGLAEIPGFTVSPEKSESNGQIQPVPHPGDEIYSGWIRDAKELYPEELESMVELWGELPSMETIKNQTVASIEAEGVEVAGDITYPVTGQSDWTPTAQQVIATGATSMHFTGEPTNLGAVTKSLREQGWDGRLVLETNMYDQTFIDSAGVENAEGAVIKSGFHPFEEAADWPATQQYMDIVNENVDDPKFAVLGMQSFSAWLLFTAAAND